MSRGTVTTPDASPPPSQKATGSLRILAVGNMYPPHHAGGYELAWQAVMRRARADGHAVRVLTTDYRADRRAEEEDGDVHRALRWYWDLDGYRFVHQERTARLRVERHNAAILRAHRSAFAPDIVAWFSMGCLSLGLIEQVRRAGLPAVFVIHDDWLVYGWQYDAWMRTFTGRARPLAPAVARLTGLPTRVAVDRAGPKVFNSRYTLRRAGEAGFDVSAASVVPPGIEAAFREPAPPQAWGWRLAYVGRIDRHKGIDTAVAALAHLPAETTLEVWGSGEPAYVAELERLAAQVGAAGRVRFHGFAAGGETLRAAYAQADAIVFPVRWEEPFGLVPLEAMGVGRPVVATARGGAAEYLRDGENALLVPSDDAGALAASVTRLAGDELLRSRLHEGGRATAARYTAERCARDTVKSIVGAARPAAG